MVFRVMPMRLSLYVERRGVAGNVVAATWAVQEAVGCISPLALAVGEFADESRWRLVCPPDPKLVDRRHWIDVPPWRSSDEINDETRAFLGYVVSSTNR